MKLIIRSEGERDDEKYLMGVVLLQSHDLPREISLLPNQLVLDGNPSYFRYGDIIGTSDARKLEPNEDPTNRRSKWYKSSYSHGHGEEMV